MEKSCSNCGNYQLCGIEKSRRCGPGVNFNEWTPKEEQTEKDPKARYYDVGNIETLDIIQAKLTPEQYEGFLLGNMIKYSCRANFKDQKTRDIEKISFYSDKLVGVTK